MTIGLHCFGDPDHVLHFYSIFHSELNGEKKGARPVTVRSIFFHYNPIQYNLFPRIFVVLFRVSVCAQRCLKKGNDCIFRLRIKSAERQGAAAFNSVTTVMIVLFVWLRREQMITIPCLFCHLLCGWMQYDFHSNASVSWRHMFCGGVKAWTELIVM